MTTQTMLEKLKAAFLNEAGVDHADPAEAAMAERYCVVFLQALREPTDEMIRAAEGANERYLARAEAAKSGLTPDYVWSYMIDAALQEKTEHQ